MSDIRIREFTMTKPIPEHLAFPRLVAPPAKPVVWLFRFKNQRAIVTAQTAIDAYLKAWPLFGDCEFTFANADVLQFPEDTRIAV